MEVPQAFADVLERVLLPEDKIRARVAELGQELSSAYAGKHLVLLGVLTGSFMFAADLSRAICLQHEVHFMKASSYKGTQSTGSVAISGLEKISLEGKHVLIVEDIVDTGLTMKRIRDALAERGCASVAAVSFLLKNTSRRIAEPPAVEYIAFEVEDEFVVGYGLDYDQRLRHLPFVGIFRSSSISQ
mmetsp:Transcript_4365/g.11944  ORF Transcript_4365/g.11944 Transcript_4365/m.11944 type:complete len:187 (-) Transcript_4365:201-761(-)